MRKFSLDYTGGFEKSSSSYNSHSRERNLTDTDLVELRVTQIYTKPNIYRRRHVHETSLVAGGKQRANGARPALRAFKTISVVN